MQETWQATDPVVAIGWAAEAMADHPRGNWISFWIYLALVPAGAQVRGRRVGAQRWRAEHSPVARRPSFCTIGRQAKIRLPAIGPATARDPIGQAVAILLVAASAHRRFPRDPAVAKELVLDIPVKEMVVDQADLVMVIIRIDRARAAAASNGVPAMAMAIVPSDRATMAGPIIAPATSTIGTSGTTTVMTIS
jgi:hypothetical protein